MVGFARRKISRGATVAGMCLMLVLAGFLIACGSSSPPVSITSVTGSSSSIFPQNTGWTNATATFTAVLANDSGNQGVTWAVTTANGGTIASTDATHATYTPPTIAAGLPSNVTITATAVADTSKTGTASIALNPTTVPGTYNVTVTMGDATTKHDNQQISLQGTVVDTVTTNAGQYYTKTYQVTVNNAAPAGANQISNQGTVSGTGFASVLTDVARYKMLGYRIQDSAAASLLGGRHG